MLELENFSLNRGVLCVADNISLKFEAGKIHAILGVNGAGKSSIIQAIFGELNFKGKISFNNDTLKQNHANIISWRKSIGYMPQDGNINASLTALEIVLLGKLSSLGIRVTDEQLEQAAGMMEYLGISHLAQQNIMTLSGGQKQMVMFAQVLQRQPKLLLLDEPVSALDMHHQCVLLQAVKKYTQENNLVTITILHDLNLAAQFTDNIVLLDKSKIISQGLPQKVLNKKIIEDLYKVKVKIHVSENEPPIIAAESAVF